MKHEQLHPPRGGRRLSQSLGQERKMLREVLEEAFHGALRMVLREELRGAFLEHGVKQGERQEKTRRLLGKLVYAEAERRPRRTKAQSWQLSLALDELRSDSRHNVRSAAKYAFGKGTGYKTLGSLYEAVRRKWNSREA